MTDSIRLQWLVNYLNERLPAFVRRAAYGWQN